MAGVLTRALERAAPQILKARITSPANDPRTSYAVALPTMRKVRKPGAPLYRSWAKASPPIRAAIDLRKGQIETACTNDWDLYKADRDGRDPDPGLMRRIRDLLESPNPGDASFAGMMSAVAEDLIVLDAGVIEKERMVRGEIAYLWPVDGATIAVDRFWDGAPRSPRYYYSPVPEVSEPLLNTDLVYMMIHRQTELPIGISYMEILKDSIEAYFMGTLVNARRVAGNAPDGIMNMGENARKEQVDAFASFYQSELEGRSVLGFWGGTKGAGFIDFGRKNVEMQFIQWIDLQCRMIAVVMMLSPQDLGLLYDTNRSNSQTQQENTEDRGQRVVLAKISDYVTTEVVQDPGFGGRANNIAFRFRGATDRSSLQKAETKKITVAGMPIQSINQARIDLGWEPIGDPNDPANPYNKLMANTPLGLVTLDKVPSAYDVTVGAQQVKAAQSAAKAVPNGGTKTPAKPSAQAPAKT